LEPMRPARQEPTTPVDDSGWPGLDVSVVIPVYGVEQTIAELVRRLCGTLQDGGWSFEIIAVDDRSPDRSAEILAELLKEIPGLRLIRFPKNFGQHAALSAGIERARGRMVFTIDGDLEYAPEDLPKLIAKFCNGEKTYAHPAPLKPEIRVFPSQPRLVLPVFFG